MDTFVTLELLTAHPAAEAQSATRRALGWFAEVERVCSRFDDRAELRRLCERSGVPRPVSPLLFEALRFARSLAERTAGAFDPTVGRPLERLGFDRDYRTGRRVGRGAGPTAGASFRDLELDPERRTATLHRPLQLDLGAVAKGLALDLAAAELGGLGDFCLEAGGDIRASGRNEYGRLWQVGVRDPRTHGSVAAVLSVDDGAVCTSGDYERRTADGSGHHLLDGRSGRPARGLASVTVAAPTALAADGLATAAFALGPELGLALLEQEAVRGILIRSDGTLLSTSTAWSEAS